MDSSSSFFLRGDPTESLFPDHSDAESTLGIRRHGRLTWITDGHKSEVCPLADMLLARAADLLAIEETVLSKRILGLDAEETGCDPTILLIQPRGEAMITPLAEGYEILLSRNPSPLLNRSQ